MRTEPLSRLHFRVKIHGMNDPNILPCAKHVGKNATPLATGNMPAQKKHTLPHPINSAVVSTCFRLISLFSPSAHGRRRAQTCIWGEANFLLGGTQLEPSDAKCADLP